MKRITLWSFASVLLIAAGCNEHKANEPKAAAPSKSESEAKTATTTATTFSDFPVPAKPEVTPALVEHGKEVYLKNCSSCHGDKGDGRGICSAFLLPQPRNFTSAQYRLRSTPTGSLPTDDDLFRAVSLGLAGTPMPPWKVMLNDSDRWAAVEYVKTFSPRFAKGETMKRIELGQAPARSEAAIAQGKTLYAKMSCATCHGEKGQGDGPSALTLKDNDGNKIAARDFSKPSGFKAGYATKEIVRGFLTGFNGTPMPSFESSLSKEDAWKLAYYVETLVKTPPATVTRESQNFLHREQLGAPDVKVKLTERAWQFDPNEIHVKKGQIVEVTFEPTDNGLGVGHGFAISSYDESAFMNGAMVGVPKTVKFRADHAGRFIFYCSTQCSTDKLHPLMNGTLIVDDEIKTASR
ncbi:MAG: Nitrous-oxide reductase [Verrucomicrobiales bacterium]|nr:Nitrous-oxide reductase [Verrucomicrobiales bacterium]